MHNGSPRLMKSTYMMLVLALCLLSVLAVAMIGAPTEAAADKQVQTGKAAQPTPAALASDPTDAGTVIPVLEGFESGRGSFTTSSSGCSCLWNSVTTAAHSGTHSAFGPDSAEAAESNLTLSDALAIPSNATSASLTFWHRYGFEFNGSFFYDGGVLEVSTDAGNTWTDAAANITAGGYNSTLTCCTNPLGGRPAWGGTTSGAFTQVQVNLMSYRGLSFRFRLRLGSDLSNGGEGWWVDDVQVSYTAPLNSCARAWSTVSDYPVALEGPAVAGVGGKLYSFGGRTAGGITAASYSYDPASNTWTPIAPLPSARYNAAAVTDGTNVYILNGNSSLTTVTNSFWRYDPSANSYTTLALPTTATGRPGAAFVNGKIYRIGGLVDPQNRTGTDTVEVYNIAASSWSAAANYPQNIYALAVMTLNGYIYAGGGEEYIEATAKTYRYNPGTNTWDDGPVADLPSVESFLTSGFYNNRWILAPAASLPGTFAIAWDPTANYWSSLDHMPAAMRNGGAGVVAGAFYVVAGYNYQNTSINTVQKYTETGCTPPSPTPAAPTATPAGPTATPPPGSTPTTCAIQFSDVAQDSTFYSFIRCLACRGILNGYSDNTFRPNNNVTRGQIAKIVANAAGFNDPQSTQLFQDVPTGSTFFDFVGRLASRNIMGGYPCGGAGEPCGGGNLPYFRPNANASRGQISKIVSNAKGFNDPQSTQLFQDVPTGSTFFDFVGRLASRNIMGGYPCGGPGEPCGGGNLPYFRPGNNATRGQTAKIVANTFLPGCQTP